MAATDSMVIATSQHHDLNKIQAEARHRRGRNAMIPLQHDMHAMHLKASSVARSNHVAGVDATALARPV